MSVTTRDLDRLVSNTMLTPVSKRALKEVRHAIMTGRATDPIAGSADWEIGISNRGNTGMTFKFSFKKVK